MGLPSKLADLAPGAAILALPGQNLAELHAGWGVLRLVVTVLEAEPAVCLCGGLESACLARPAVLREMTVLGLSGAAVAWGLQWQLMALEGADAGVAVAWCGDALPQAALQGTRGHLQWQ